VERKIAEYEFVDCKCCKGSGKCSCCKGNRRVKTELRVVHLIPEDKVIVEKSSRKYDKMKEKYDKIGFDFLIVSMITVVALMILGIVTKSFIVLIGIVIPVFFLYLTLIIYGKSDEWWKKYLEVRYEIANKYGIEKEEIFVIK